MSDEQLHHHQGHDLWQHVELRQFGSRAGVCALLAYDVCAPGEYGGLEWRARTVAKVVL